MIAICPARCKAESLCCTRSGLQDRLQCAVSWFLSVSVNSPFSSLNFVMWPLECEQRCAHKQNCNVMTQGELDLPRNNSDSRRSPLNFSFPLLLEWDQPKPRMYGRQDLSHLLDKMFPEDKVATAKEGHLRVFQLGKNPYNLIIFSMNT